MDHPLGVLIRKGVKENGANHAENRYARADTQGQRSNNDDSKAGRFPKLSQPESHVLKQGPEKRGKP
jgi:hypothetical protein